MEKRISYKSRIINEEKAKDLIKQGYFALDPHCHSCFSYDVPDVIETSPEVVIAEQQRLGLKTCISDHDTLNGFYYMKSKKLTGTVMTNKGMIPAAEIKIKPLKAKLVSPANIQMHTIHINVFGLNKEQLRMLESIAEKDRDLDAFVKYLKEHDLDWMFNHPFWHEPYEKLNWAILPGLAKNYFDVIELNSGRPKVFNDLAIHMAEQFNKGIVASTDSHIGKPGRAYVLAEGKNFKEFWKNVKAGKMYVVRKDMTTFGVVSESADMISNIFKANVHASKERQLIPDTGVKTFDNVARAVTSGRLKRMYFAKKLIHTLLYTFNYTAGPILAWRYYMKKNDNLAQKITNRIKLIVRDLKNEPILQGRITLHKQDTDKKLSNRHTAISK